MESIITAAMVLGMYFNTVNGNEVNNLYDVVTMFAVANGMRY